MRFEGQVDDKGYLPKQIHPFDSLTTPRIGTDKRLLTHSPGTNLTLCKNIEVAGESFDIASDWHLPSDERLIDTFVRSIEHLRSADIFICAGDVFDARNGEDRSLPVSLLMNRLAEKYDAVLYVPGNHCLRSRANPWESFSFVDNVYMPLAEDPILFQTEKNIILLGNIFYDFKFLDPSIFRFSDKDLRAFYPLTSDGQYLLAGDVRQFIAMSDAFAECLTPDVTVMVSHVLPHVASTYVKIDVDDGLLRRRARELGLMICDDDRRLAEAADYWQCTEEQARIYWNKKCFLMGSNILDHPQANPRDGLTALHGHNHRQADREIRARNGARIKLLSHQPCGGNPELWLT